ncbi:MAG TPA: DUF3108 domain-containing protein [Steroidobacteraceae bacterium]|nr:DUF3108 domain-containing protein [Steroidobacteraceae bacterium]
MTGRTSTTQTHRSRAGLRAPAVLFALACAGLASALPSVARADAGENLQPYTARYQVSYRGLNGGEIEATFRRGNGNGLWQYETRAFPSLLGRLAVSSQAHESSTMLVSANGVRPLSFAFDDGSSGASKDVRLDYDWAGGKVTGSAEGKAVAITLLPDTQDTASVQAAMIQARLAGRKPASFRIITGGKLREYRYWFEGKEQVMTPFGQVEAEIWANQRDGSSRLSKVWHAPSLGFVPVQAIQYRKGNPEVQMKLLKLER